MPSLLTRASSQSPSSIFPAVQLPAIRLMAERVDVRAGVLGHHEQRRRARAPLQVVFVAAMQVDQHPRLVGRPHRRTRVARLLEVVGTRPEQRVYERRHSSARISRPCVSGRNISATMPRTYPNTPKATAPPSPITSARTPMMAGNNAPRPRPTL